MKTSLFPKLAWSSIKKNYKLYIPYFLSCIGSVMMYYIISYLSLSPAVKDIKGGNDLTTILGMGKFVIVAFALIFLIYTNSFLVRRRNMEFGLYNILGMDKRSISKILVWESLITAAISIAAGLTGGILFSKLSELVLLYMVHAETNYTLSVSADSIKYTVGLFAVIFLVLLIKSVVSVRRSNPLELMNSEHAGEKPPKANWIFAALGVLILGTAYVMSVTIKSPLSAIFSFLVAVVLVIIGTYLLFISGSVALCRILQRNKKYYYKKNHFVSVSSMAYRMKRNGAGLASICILSTMVLVMIASSASLYFGADDAIKSRFPQENQITAYISKIDYLDDEHISPLRKGYENILDEHKATASNITEYTYCEITGLYTGSGIDADSSHVINDMVNYDNLRQIYFTSVNEYNKAMGTNLNLKKNEALVYTLRCDFNKEYFEMGDTKLHIAGRLDKYPEISGAKVAIIPSIMMVISDYEDIRPLETLADFNGDQMLDICWYYGYDLGRLDNEAITIHREQIYSLLDSETVRREGENITSFSYNDDCLAAEHDDFYTTFGGLFYIGIVLSIVFMFAMAMIIYYKQISEGFEDSARFEIMQKVGMTKSDIKKSINSQLLTVFFMPLGFAVLHLCFAFPIIKRLLMMFHLTNVPLLAGTAAAAAAVFALLYAVVYKITSRVYYNIVS